MERLEQPQLEALKAYRDELAHVTDLAALSGVMREAQSSIEELGAMGLSVLYFEVARFCLLNEAKLSAKADLEQIGIFREDCCSAGLTGVVLYGRKEVEGNLTEESEGGIGKARDLRDLTAFLIDASLATIGGKLSLADLASFYQKSIDRTEDLGIQNDSFSHECTASINRIRLAMHV